MKSDAPESRAQSIVDQSRVRTLVSEARASLKDSARRVARAGLESQADARVLKLYSEAVELAEQALERALDSLAARGAHH